MEIVNEKKNCSGCYACFNACPTHSIEMRKDDEGFYYPSIDSKSCINCGICKKVCPSNVNSDRERFNIIGVYGCKNLSAFDRTRSSSGGLFILLAKQIIKEGGFVFGAAFSDDFLNVAHTYASCEEELSLLQTSKYVQSRICNSYLDVRKVLSSGKKVLFSGTPCQIDGLKLFLNKEYDNLICVEVICHGVPSEKVWQKYLQEYPRKYGSIKSINFRNKKNGWKKFSLEIVFEKKRVYSSREKDAYLIPFLKNISLRPSCYNCNSKTHRSSADLIIGDFWRIGKIEPSFSDDLGVSMVIVNSEIGNKYLLSIMPMIELIPVDKQEIVEHKSAFRKSPMEPEIRKQFFSDINLLPLKKATKKTVKSSFFSKLRKIIKGG